MPSIVWGRDPQEAYEEPYEYEAQDQFVREAESLLPALYKLLNSDQHRYAFGDRSTEKAVWLLHMDALDGLFDSLESLIAKRHRVAGQLFRSIEEALDLAALFASRTPRATQLLSEWYDNQVIPHRKYREHLSETEGPEIAKQRAEHYHRMSKFTHRTHRAIMDGYSRGGEERIVHDRTGLLYGEHADAPTFLVLPHTLAAYLVVLGGLITLFMDQLKRYELVPAAALAEVVDASLEKETVPRRFMPRRWIRPRTELQEDS